MIPLLRTPIWAYNRVIEKMTNSVEAKKANPFNLFIEITGKTPSAVKNLSMLGQNNQSWYIQAENKEYKLFHLGYEQISEHINEITTYLNSVGVKLPEYIGTDKSRKYVVTEWVEGKSISYSDVRDNLDILHKVAQLQAKINITNSFVPKHRGEEFFYMHKVIIPRYLHWSKIRFGKDINKVNERIMGSLEKHFVSLKEKRTLVITNPDFTINNLVLTDNEEIVVIDTEFIVVDYGADLEVANFLNKLKHFSAELVDEYTESYEKICPLDNFRADRTFSEACIEMRNIGKQLKYLRTDSRAIKNSIYLLDEVLSAA